MACSAVAVFKRPLTACLRRRRDTGGCALAAIVTFLSLGKVPYLFRGDLCLHSSAQPRDEALESGQRETASAGVREKERQANNHKQGYQKGKAMIKERAL
jgi:hypothetical protein